MANLSRYGADALRAYGIEPDRARAATIPAFQSPYLQRHPKLATRPNAGAADGVPSTGVEDDIFATVSTLNPEQRQAALQKAQILKQAASSLQVLPYAERRSALQRQTLQLSAAGLDLQTIRSFDPTDRNLGAILDSVANVSQALHNVGQFGSQRRNANASGERAVSNRPAEWEKQWTAQFAQSVPVGGRAFASLPAPSSAQGKKLPLHTSRERMRSTIADYDPDVPHRKASVVSWPPYLPPIPVQRNSRMAVALPPDMPIPPNFDIDAALQAARKNGWNAVWFKKQVEKGGDWDFKNKNKYGKDSIMYQPFGNFFYGLAGRVAGWKEDTLLRMAGWAHQQDNPRSDIPGNPGVILSLSGTGGFPPYGDDYIDQAWVTRGIDFYESSPATATDRQKENDKRVLPGLRNPEFGLATPP